MVAKIAAIACRLLSLGNFGRLILVGVGGVGDGVVVVAHGRCPVDAASGWTPASFLSIGTKHAPLLPKT
jgi:hypothetical protein